MKKNLPISERATKVLDYPDFPKDVKEWLIELEKDCHEPKKFVQELKQSGWHDGNLTDLEAVCYYIERELHRIVSFFE